MTRDLYIERAARDLATRAAWARYEAENAAGRLSYRRHPIVTTAVCEVCGHTSATALCPTCKENTE